MEKSRLFSILESVFFFSPQPVSLSQLESLFENKLKAGELKKILKEFQEDCKKSSRGVCLEIVGKAYQLRTKTENREHLLKMIKKRSFRLSQPALEVLTAIAYNQPCIKQQIDEIRGTDSGHLFRTLMEGGLICFAGKSKRPGKPSLYKTTNKFLEIFGFNSLEDLPSEEEINKLLPPVKPSVSLENEPIMEALSPTQHFVEDEKEHQKIGEALKNIPTTVKFSKENT